jgi:hypothetical protein
MLVIANFIQDSLIIPGCRNGECVAWGDGRFFFLGFCWENLKERDCLEDLDVDRTIILKICFNKEIKYEGLDYIYLAKDQNY